MGNCRSGISTKDGHELAIANPLKDTANDSASRPSSAVAGSNRAAATVPVTERSSAKLSQPRAPAVAKTNKHVESKDLTLDSDDDLAVQVAHFLRAGAGRSAGDAGAASSWALAYYDILGIMLLKRCPPSNRERFFTRQHNARSVSLYFGVLRVLAGQGFIGSS